MVAQKAIKSQQDGQYKSTYNSRKINRKCKMPSTYKLKDTLWRGSVFLSVFVRTEIRYKSK